MRYSVLGFNQAKVVETELDLTDLALLQYIIQANGSPAMKHVVENEISYVWLSHAKIQEDLPILAISDSTLKHRIAKLKKDGWIDSVINRTRSGAQSYYSITLKTTELLYSTDDVEKSARAENGTCARAENGTSDSKLIDSKLKDISKDISEPTGSFLGSAKPKPIVKKLTLFDKCVSKNTEFTSDIKLQIALNEYLTVRLAMKDKPLLGVNQWVGMLNKLKVMSNQMEVVQQSIAHGWAMFYELKTGGSNYTSGVDKFSEYGTVKSEKREEEYYGNF